MKRYLIVLPLLTLGAPVLANTATIQFTGEVVAGSCPIAITDPAGATGAIDMGEAMAGNFKTAGTEANYREFIIKVQDPENCPGWNGAGSNVANVRFFGLAGGAEGGQLFALKPAAVPATGVALGIKDATGASVGHGGTSSDYPLTGGNGPEDLKFTAFYKSTAASVGAGQANADVSVELSIN